MSAAAKPLTRPMEGWQMPDGSRRSHFFRARPNPNDITPTFDLARSLCGKWGWHWRWKLYPPLMVDGGWTAADDCATCRKKLEQERATA